MVKRISLLMESQVTAVTLKDVEMCNAEVKLAQNVNPNGHKALLCLESYGHPPLVAVGIFWS